MMCAMNTKNPMVLTVMKKLSANSLACLCGLMLAGVFFAANSASSKPGAKAAPKVPVQTPPRDVVAPPISSGEQGATIEYSLPQAGKVSLAIYDASGKMVRTLASGAAQPAGKNSMVWDGLDRTGKAVPAGDYSWKLLLSQGMKAEYMLALGTSFGINHWIGQHGGPNTVATDGDSFVAGGMPEGSPMLGLAGFDGSYRGNIGAPMAGAGPDDLTWDNGRIYSLLTGGSLFGVDAKTQKIKGLARLNLPVRSLGPVAPGSGPRTMNFDVTPGSYLIKMKIGQEDKPNAWLQLKWNGSPANFYASPAGKYQEVLLPRTYDACRPIRPNDKGQLELWMNNVITGETAPYAVADMQLLAAAEHIDARFGEVVASFQGGNAIAWINADDDKILEQVQVPQARDVALVAPGVALAISGDEIIEATRDGKTSTKISGVSGAKLLAFDAQEGGLWLFDGAAQQVKYFDKSFKNTKTFGRKGGREQGPYVPEDFLGVSAIASDGKGGFLIAEDDSAPRRVAHFDAGGKLLKEWYGGQQFYTFAAANPAHPNRIWMDSQWGWVMEVEVDWKQRNWKVVGTYQWPTDGFFVSRKGMAWPHYVRTLDLNKDGKEETYLLSGNQAGTMLLVDEKMHRLRPVALLAEMNSDDYWGWANTPPERMPAAWTEAMSKAGGDPKNKYSWNTYRGFGWADSDNDGQVQAGELRFGKSSRALPLLLDNNLDLYISGGGSWQVIPPQGQTKDGYPIWDWTKNAVGPASPYTTTKEIRKDAGGNIYAVVQGGAGDGFTGGGTYAMGHGAQWPANQTDSNAVIKWDKDGNKLWETGFHASGWGQSGRLSYPVHLAGIANSTIGVCDKIIQPVAFWTDDGLYAGGLFDRRADDGLPPRVYRWWLGGTDDFNPETGRAPIQYDMALGGSLLKLGNGDVVFIGSGWNNCPVYKVTGWEDFQRQGGKIVVEKPVIVSSQSGVGLKGEYYAGAKLEGEPLVTQTEPRIWFDAAKKSGASFVWPDAAAQKEAYSARWTGTVQPKFSEAYTFSLYGARGEAKLFVAGSLVAQSSGQKGEWKQFSSPQSLLAGQKYPVVLEWSGAKGTALHLNWESPSQPIEHIPTSALYPEGTKGAVQ